MNQSKTPVEWWNTPEIKAVMGQGEADTKWPLQSGVPMGNTGYGPDGHNQPHNPVAIVQTANGPIALHEGEPVMQMPDGRVRVVSQAELKKQIAGRRVPGMYSGGEYDAGASTKIATGLRGADESGLSATSKLAAADIGGTAQNVGSFQGGSASGISLARAPLPPPDNTPDAYRNGYSGPGGGAFAGGYSRDANGNIVKPAPAPDNYGIGIDYLRNVVTGTNQQQRAIADRAIEQQGLIAGADRAAYEQELAQNGVSGTGIESLSNVKARDASGKQSDMIGDMAGDAATRQQTAAGQLVAQGWTEKTHAEDVARTNKTDTETSAANSITSAFNADPNLRTTWDQNSGVVASLRAQWEANPALNQGQPFDLNNPQVRNWAQGRVDALTVTPADAAINSIQASSWFKALPAAEKTKWTNEIFPALATVAATGGKLDMVRDAQGNITGWALKSADGDVIMSSDGYEESSAATTTYDWTKPADQARGYTAFTGNVDMGDAYSSEAGLTAYAQAHNGEMPASASQYTSWQRSGRVYNTDNATDMGDAQETALDMGFAAGDFVRLKEYMDSHGGKLPSSKAAFDTWNTSSGSRTAVTSWASGNGTLTPQAIAALPDMMTDGSLGQAADYNFASGSVSMPPVGNTVDATANLSTGTLSWASANKGKVITIDGHQYVIDPNTPTQTVNGVATGTNVYRKSHSASAEGIRLVDSSGKAFVYIPKIVGNDTSQYGPFKTQNTQMFSWGGDWTLVDAPALPATAGSTQG